MTYVYGNPDWKPATRLTSTGSPKLLTVEWEREPDQKFRLTNAERKAVLRGEKVLVR